MEAAQNQTPGYGPTQIVSGGDSAAIGSGIGVRRATLTIDRTAAIAGADPATMHLDFLNVTAGTPDDTWISSDFSTMEGHIHTFWGTIKAYVPSSYKLSQITWHRIGTGVPKPNPAERVFVETTPIAGVMATPSFPPQVACSFTFRTGVRKSWGRTYMPIAASIGTTRQLANADVDILAGAANTLLSNAASSDFHLVVVSKTLASSLNVEQVEVDSNLDVIRRRRWKQSTYRKILP